MQVVDILIYKGREELEVQFLLTARLVVRPHTMSAAAEQLQAESTAFSDAQHWAAWRPYAKPSCLLIAVRCHRLIEQACGISQARDALLMAVSAAQSVALQHKQRHHLIGQFIMAPQKLREQMARKRPISEFLENFYTNRLP